jgi:VWFA-related protein
MMRPVTVRRALGGALAGVVIGVAAGVFAQQGTPPQDPAQQPIFRARVNLVRVDVSVTGRDDEPVDDLTAADFLVKEDGLPQTVESAQFVRLSGQPPEGMEESIDIRSPAHAAVEAAKEDVRLFVIFLDDYHVDKSPQVMIPLRRTLKALADKFGPYDLVAIMDPLTPLSHLEFTRSREELHERIRTFEGRRGELFPIKSAAEEAQQTQRNVWELRAGVTLDAMNAVVTRLGGLREGRKSVIFVSQGPPLSGPRSINWPRMEDVVQSANRGNVTIHTLDPRPLGMVEFGGNLVLRRFSDETGGRAIFNTNDHAQHLEGIFSDASAYYLVAYTPTRELADGRFHKIDVDVKRRGLRVVARRGYWAPKAEELNAPAPTPVAPEVMSALADLAEPKSGRTAEVWIGYARAAGNTATTVTWDPTSRAGADAAVKIDVERMLADGTPDGDAQTLPRREGSTAAAAARFRLPPGKSTLRFTTYAADGEVLDRWVEDVDVPELGGAVSLATPRFLLARSAFELRALQNAPDTPPSATRRVRKSDRLLVELEAYSQTGSPELVAELLNQKGDSLVTLPVPALSANRTRFELPLQSLAPAVYVLRVRAKTADAQAEQLAPFRVVP